MKGFVRPFSYNSLIIGMITDDVFFFQKMPQQPEVSALFFDIPL